MGKLEVGQLGVCPDQLDPCLTLRGIGLAAGGWARVATTNQGRSRDQTCWSNSAHPGSVAYGVRGPGLDSAE